MEELLKLLREYLTKQVTACHGFLDSAGEGLGDAGRREIQSWVEDINKTLEKLPGTRQDSAESGVVVQCLMGALTRTDGITQSILERLAQATQDHRGLVTQLNGLKDELKTNYILKADSERAVTEARESEKKILLPELIATRRSALELNGMPVPEEAILGLPAAEFNNRQTAARENLKTAEAKGLSLDGKGKLFIQHKLWLPKAEFCGALDQLADLLPPPLKGAATQRNRHPLIGAGGEDSDNASVLVV